MKNWINSQLEFIQPWPKTLIAASCLLGLVVFTYIQFPSWGFIWDDIEQVQHNPALYDGITPRSVIWAFTTTFTTNWHPVTWLSHLLDYQIYGSSVMGHHLTSVFLHLLNTLLCFYLLKRWTSSNWLAFFCAGIFGLHPVQLDSVAWLSQRKNLLSTMFGLSAMIVYLDWGRYRKQGLYIAVLVLMALSLMSKSMLVTLPIVFLLLDIWPLQRWVKGRTKWPLIVEKLPFFMLSLGVGLIQLSIGFLWPLEHFPLWVRLSNAVLSYVRYLIHYLVPIRLAIFYEYPQVFSGWMVLGSAFGLALTTLSTYMLRRKWPFLFVGWSWYLIILLPVIGIIQVGRQSMADRYAYVPLIGLLMILSMVLKKVLEKVPSKRTHVFIAGSIVLLSLSILNINHGRNYRSSIQAFRHVVSIQPYSAFGHLVLSQLYVVAGRPDLALPHAQLAAKLDPNNGRVYDTLGQIYQDRDTDQAIAFFKKAMKLLPENPEIINNLGIAYAKSDQIEEAAAIFQQAITLNPAYRRAYENLARCREMLNDSAGAQRIMEQARRIKAH